MRFLFVLQQHRGAHLELNQLDINVTHIGSMVEVARLSFQFIEVLNVYFLMSLDLLNLLDIFHTISTFEYFPCMIY